MADVFTNDLRIREQEVGANSGSWGGYLNTSLENIAEAFSYGTEALADSAAQTLTLADGASDELRSFYVKLTGTLSQATTVTLAPNTISKVWMIENATSGGYAVTISQGSGANVTVGNGNVKMIATDGAGAGGVVYDLLTDLQLAGKLLLGTPASRAMSGVTPNIFIEGTDFASSSLGIVNNSATSEPILFFGHSRGSSLGSSDALQSGDRIGAIFFNGADGTDIQSQSASIQAYVDGTPGSDDMPGRLTFHTSADGGVSNTERMRIQNSGITQFKTGDGNSGIAEFHTNASSGNTTGYISIRPQGTAKGYIGNGSSLLSGANVGDFIFRSENNAVINSGGNSESIRADNDGAVTLNKQPSFMARGLGQSNLANGTQLHFPSANEIIDRGSDYDGSSSIFTAPVTGIYNLSVNVRLISVTADASYIIVRLITSNRTYDWIWDPRPGDATWDYVTATINVLADMDASDTAYVYYYQSGGTFNNDTGSAVGHFSGYLVA